MIWRWKQMEIVKRITTQYMIKSNEVWTNITGIWASNVQSNNFKIYAESQDTEAKVHNTETLSNDGKL